MEEEDPDWDLIKVKLEPEILLNENDDTDNSSTGSYSEFNHQASTSNYTQKNSAAQPENNLNLKSDTAAHSASNASFNVRNSLFIKEEKTEDENSVGVKEKYNCVAEDPNFKVLKIKEERIEDENHVTVNEKYNCIVENPNIMVPKIKEDEDSTDVNKEYNCIAVNKNYGMPKKMTGGGDSVTDSRLNTPSSSKIAQPNPLRIESILPQERIRVKKDIIATGRSSISEVRTEGTSLNTMDILASKNKRNQSFQIFIPKTRHKTESEGVQTSAPFNQSEFVPGLDNSLGVHYLTQSSGSQNLSTKHTGQNHAAPNVKLPPTKKRPPDLISISTGCPAPNKKSSSVSCSTPRVKQKKPKCFTCLVCSAQFKRSSHLKRHSLIHSDKRDFACQVCSFQFKLKSHLQEHMLTHSDARAFSCSRCTAHFKRKSELNRHFLSHLDKS